MSIKFEHFLSKGQKNTTTYRKFLTKITFTVIFMTCLLYNFINISYNRLNQLS